MFIGESLRGSERVLDARVLEPVDPGRLVGRRERRAGPGPAVDAELHEHGRRRSTRSCRSTGSVATAAASSSSGSVAQRAGGLTLYRVAHPIRHRVGVRRRGTGRLDGRRARGTSASARRSDRPGHARSSRCRAARPAATIPPARDHDPRLAARARQGMHSRSPARSSSSRGRHRPLDAVPDPHDRASRDAAVPHRPDGGPHVPAVAVRPAPARACRSASASPRRAG